jgi:hypothetical protein
VSHHPHPVEADLAAVDGQLVLGNKRPNDIKVTVTPDEAQL